MADEDLVRRALLSPSSSKPLIAFVSFFAFVLVRSSIGTGVLSIIQITLFYVACARLSVSTHEKKNRVSSEMAKRREREKGDYTVSLQSPGGFCAIFLDPLSPLSWSLQ